MPAAKATSCQRGSSVFVCHSQEKPLMTGLYDFEHDWRLKVVERLQWRKKGHEPRGTCRSRPVVGRTRTHARQLQLSYPRSGAVLKGVVGGAVSMLHWHGSLSNDPATTANYNCSRT